MKVCLVCSAGGHLLQLHRLEPWWSRHDRCWVTFQMADSESLLSDERVYWAHHPTTRNAVNAVRNLFLAFRVLRAERPSILVSDGAGVAFPFFVAAKALGIKTVYVEVYDRLDSATLTGRLCRPIADRVLLQWEEQLEYYPDGQVIGPLL